MIPPNQPTRCRLWIALLLLPLAWSGHAQSTSDTNLNYATPYTFSVFAGNPRQVGEKDGTNGSARFNAPNALAFGPDGNLFVADANGGRIRRVTSDGVVTTLPDFFQTPEGIAVDLNTNVIIAGEGNSTIVMMSPSGTNWTMRVIGGKSGFSGTNDGPGLSARFSGPNSVAVDQFDDIYVADEYNHTIRLMTPVSGTNWVVSTIAGAPGVAGTNDGFGPDARFNKPVSLAVDDASNIYVTEWLNHTVRKISPQGTNWFVQTIAGLATVTGAVDGPGAQARFYSPSGVALDGLGGLFITDQRNDLIRKIDLRDTNYTVTTLAGSPQVAGTNDGVGSAALFNFEAGIAVARGDILFVADTDGDTVRRGYFFSPIQISASPTEGVAPLTVNFSSPNIDSQSNLLVAWDWIFGDGSGSPVLAPVYTFSNSGLYRVTLLATNILGGISEGSLDITAFGDGVTITSYTGADAIVLIPPALNGTPVRSIGDGAFASVTNLAVVSIPSTIVVIGSDAFADDTNLNVLIFAGSPPTADPTSFHGDSNAVAWFSPSAPGWSSLYDSLTAEVSPFAYTLTSNSFTITAYTGSNTVLSIPSGVTTIGQAAFESANIVDLTIPGSVTTLDLQAFAYCPGLTNINTSSGLSSIGVDSFGGVPIGRFYVPASVTNIGQSAFIGCALLTNIDVDPENPFYLSIGGVLYDKSGATLLEFPDGLTGSYSLPTGTSVIGSNAFDPNCGITNLYLPATLTEIDSFAFFECYQLQAAYFLGPAPTLEPNFIYDVPAALYVIPGLPGWSAVPGVQFWTLPFPIILPNDGNLTDQNGAISFTIAWATNASFIVQACSDLSHLNWQPIQTNATDPASATLLVTDPLDVNSTGRFYRVIAQ
jgi:PKD repeat protein